ncbi:hypothetical protein COU37_00890 [Candidatus Micrarchaeota archaeon CG10_big_fil_rev_8_21_14_0_10_45_29]|nr:MAG: hypothetical protein COU37_00890 [Candidatus Micrarchaeota archaeon CG10_big_fil_rev_8_21_14_0_10_45_29]
MAAGQSAMEFLLTYGWALLVIAIVVAALMVIVPLQSPDTCTFSTSYISCSEHRLLSEDESTSSSGKKLTNVVYANIRSGEKDAIEIYGMACARGGKPKIAEDGNFKDALFRLDAGGKITGSNAKAILLRGNSLNVGSMPGTIKFRMQCVDVDEGGNVLAGQKFLPGETFSGDIYIAYKLRGEPEEIPPKIARGRLVAKVQ